MVMDSLSNTALEAFQPSTSTTEKTAKSNGGKGSRNNRARKRNPAKDQGKDKPVTAPTAKSVSEPSGYSDLQAAACIAVVPDADAVTVNAVLRVLYPDICRYVAAHAVGNAGADIAAADIVQLRLVNSVYGFTYTTVAATRFDAVTVALWAADVTNAEWQTWRKVNAAAAEQRTTVSGFKISSSTGSEAQTVRFPTLVEATTLQSYYCSRVVDQSVLRAVSPTDKISFPLSQKIM